MAPKIPYIPEKFQCYIYLLGKWGKREVLICIMLKVNCVKRILFPFPYQTRCSEWIAMLLNSIVMKIKGIVQIQARKIYCVFMSCTLYILVSKRLPK